MSARRNIYDVDDWLIRGGYGLALVTLLAPACSAGVIRGGVVSWFSLGLVLAGAILVLGYAVRADERRIAHVWGILEHATEVVIDELVASTGYSRAFVHRAVQVINRQPGSYYVWDEAHGTIVDGRLRTRMHVVERCESCGAAINVSLSLDVPRVPTCEHCGGPVTAGDLNDLKRAHIETLRSDSAPLGHPFRLWLFLLLFVLSGGIAAVLYAVWTTGFFDRLLGTGR